MSKTIRISGQKYQREPTKVPTAEDICWAAGFYDGEGNCETPGLSANVVQKDPEPLYWLRNWFGGDVRLLSRKHWKNESFGNGDIYRWRVSGDLARLFLQLVYPYLTSRRKAQIDRTSAFRFTGIVRDTRPNISDERKALRAHMTLKQKMV